MQELLFHGNVTVEASRPHARALSIALMCVDGVRGGQQA